MTDSANRALLPQGLRDVLPPDAAFEASVAERLLATFASFGYERVKPPLVEFEESLLSGAGAAMAAFRLMDPASQRMLGVRADITPQVARIATTRLKAAPRPLRLSYGGAVLCVAATQLRPEREFVQVGAELIGADTTSADAEVIVLAAEALGAAGVDRLSIDLTLPTLAPAVCDGLGLDADARSRARAALDRKDAAAVADIGGEAAVVLGAMLRAAGPHVGAREALADLDLPRGAAALRERLSEVAGLVADAAPRIGLTIDPVEHRGFEYQTGVSFTIFGLGVRGELGRGGRYRAGDGESEPATGVTLFMDTVLRGLPDPAPPDRLYLPAGAGRGEGARLRAEGWIVVAGLDTHADAAAEARRLGCTHLWLGGEAVAVAES